MKIPSLVIVAAGTASLLAGESLVPPSGGPFDVTKALGPLIAHGFPVIIRGFKVANRQLYFLLSADPSGTSSVLVRASLRGTIEQVTPLGKDAATELSIDQSGTAWVRFDTPGFGRGDPLKTIGQDGTQRVLPDLRSFGPIAAYDDSLYGVTASGNVTRLSGGTSQLLPFRVAPLEHVDDVLSIPNVGLAALDRAKGDIRIVNLSTGTSVSVTLASPDIDKARFENNRRPAPPNVRRMLVQADTADESGSIYFMLTGFRPQDGAPVLVLTPQGRQLDEIRIQRTGEGRWILPVAVGVSEGRLYLVDASGLVFVYELPHDLLTKTNH